MTKSSNILPNINSDAEYDQLNLNDELFKNAAREILIKHNFPDKPLSLLGGTNIVFSYDGNRIIKIFPPIHNSQFKSESLVMKHLNKKLTVTTPAIEFEGEISGWPYIIMNRLEGVPLEGLWERLDHSNKTIILRELGSLIREVHSLPTQGLEAIDCHWEKFIANQMVHCVEKHKSTNLPENLLKQIPEYIKSMAACLPIIKKPVILTGEYTPMNFLVKQKSGVWHIEGLIDFGDAMLGLPEYDLLGPGAFLIQGDKTLLREFLISYGYSADELTDKLSHQLTLLMLLHKYSNLNVQVRIDGWKEKVGSLNELEKLVWGTDKNMGLEFESKSHVTMNKLGK